MKVVVLAAVWSVAGALSTQQDANYRSAWKSVTSGGKPAEKPSKGPQTPERREREWAAKIIEQHERRKKAMEIRSVCDRVAEKLIDPTDHDATPRASTKEEDRRQRMLLDVFDGRLGPVQVSLRSSAEAMLSVVGVFTAETTEEPGIVVVRGQWSDGEPADDVECVIDARRCSGADFAQRTGQDGRNQLAITLKRLDDASFLSVLLGSPTAETAARWRELKIAYEGAAFGRPVVLMPEGGVESKPPSVDSGPLRPQSGDNLRTTSIATPAKGSPDDAQQQQPPKRTVKPKKAEVLIPRIK